MTLQLPGDLPPEFEGLPASLVEVAQVLGLRVALGLMREFGGREMRFPKSPGPHHPIIKALGEEDGRALCHYLADQTLYVPHGRAASNRRQVVALEDAGLTRGQIARRLQLSARHVRRLSRSAGDDRQGDFFGYPDEE